jgi:small subunit ribosomal protein S16
MVRIRLRRVGAKHQPSYRLVVADKESPRDGRFLEVIGQYNPRTSPASISVDEARLFHWLKNGAQPSESAVKILRSHGVWARWERLKQGEPLEALLEEAKSASQSADTRTRRDDLGVKKASKKAKAKAVEAEGGASEPPANAS